MIFKHAHLQEHEQTEESSIWLGHAATRKEREAKVGSVRANCKRLAEKDDSKTREGRQGTRSRER